MTASFKEVLREVAQSFGDIDAVFNVVAKLKDHSDELVADLTEALDDDDFSIQAAAAFSLCHLFYVFWPEKIDGCISTSKLLTLIDDDDPRMRFETTRAVAVLQVGRKCRLTDEQIVAVYIGCIQCGDLRLKFAVAGQVGMIGPAAIAALPPLSRMLDYDDPEVRQSVWVAGVLRFAETRPSPALELREDSFAVDAEVSRILAELEVGRLTAPAVPS